MHSHLSNKSGAVSWCCISCRVQTPAKYLMLGGGNPLIVVGPCKSRQLQLILVLLSIFSKVLVGILAILVLYLDDNITITLVQFSKFYFARKLTMSLIR